jgi:hypothetical protein
MIMITTTAAPLTSKDIPYSITSLFIFSNVKQAMNSQFKPEYIPRVVVRLINIYVAVLHRIRQSKMNERLLSNMTPNGMLLNVRESPKQKKRLNKKYKNKPFFCLDWLKMNIIMWKNYRPRWQTQHEALCTTYVLYLKTFVSDCCLMPSEQFFSHILVRISYSSMRW